MFTIATVCHSGSGIVQSLELARGTFFFRATPPASWELASETRREIGEQEARDTVLVWRDLACEGELQVLSEDQLLLETHFGARHLEMLVGEAPQQEPDEEHIPNEEGTLPAAFDPEAQEDLELHNALHLQGYGR